MEAAMRALTNSVCKPVQENPLIIVSAGMRHFYFKLCRTVWCVEPEPGVTY